MKSSVEQITPVKKRLTVEVDAEAVNGKSRRLTGSSGRGPRWTVFVPGKCPATFSKDISGTR